MEYVLCWIFRNAGEFHWQICSVMVGWIWEGLCGDGAGQRCCQSQTIMSKGFSLKESAGISSLSG